MDDKIVKPRVPSAELRKVAVVVLRISVLSLVLTIVGVFLDWFHWSWIVMGVAAVVGAYVAEIILNALADMSGKIDLLVGKQEGCAEK